MVVINSLQMSHAVNIQYRHAVTVYNNNNIDHYIHRRYLCVVYILTFLNLCLTTAIQNICNKICADKYMYAHTSMNMYMYLMHTHTHMYIVIQTGVSKIDIILCTHTCICILMSFYAHTRVYIYSDGGHKIDII